MFSRERQHRHLPVSDGDQSGSSWTGAGLPATGERVRDDHVGKRHRRRDGNPAAGAGGLPAVIKALHAGAAYANVHTNVSPGGEIQGQIRTIAK
jgi:hypothetical protein